MRRIDGLRHFAQSEMAYSHTELTHRNPAPLRTTGDNRNRVHDLRVHPVRQASQVKHSAPELSLTHQHQISCQFGVAPQIVTLGIAVQEAGPRLEAG